MIISDHSSAEKGAFIWDLDGTLADSYEAIASGLSGMLTELGVDIGRDEILKDVITHSVSYFNRKVENITGVPADELQKRYSEFEDKEKINVTADVHALEILRILKDRGIPSYLYTHRGPTTEFILENTGLGQYLEDSVTGEYGFKRKPDPSGLNYLIDKHKLDREKTFYVGDRQLDIESANNAGIKSILYLPKNSVAEISGRETYVVSDLLQIEDIIKQF